MSMAAGGGIAVIAVFGKEQRRLNVWRARFLLIPLGMIAELTMLAICWLVALVKPKLAAKMTAWAISFFPTKGWYIGEA